MKAAAILDNSQTLTSCLELQATSIESTPIFSTLADPGRAIRESQQQQKVQAKTALLPQLAMEAHEKGVSLFKYLGLRRKLILKP